MDGSPPEGTVVVRPRARTPAPFDPARMRLAVSATGLLLLLTLTWPAALRGDEPAPAPTRTARARPPQGYAHQAVRRSEFGRGATSYWLFEPAEPTPEQAPVVVLNHGWLAVNPAAYGAWIEHLVRSGRVVIFPRYQTDPLTPPGSFLPNALAAVTDALDVLATAPGRVRPDRDRFALVGHSAGGNLAAQMAAVWVENHLPRPRAVVALMPGEVQPLRGPDLADIPADTLLAVAVADGDRVVGDARAREIFLQARAIPVGRKIFVFFRSDLHGTPRLVAHHFAPTALDLKYDSGDGLLKGVQWNLAEINALDRAGVWRLTDLTLDAAFAGQTLDAASHQGDLLRHLGFWSDGRPVRAPIVTPHLATVPRVVPFNGVRLVPWSLEGWGLNSARGREPGRDGAAVPADSSPTAAPARIAETDLPKRR